MKGSRAFKIDIFNLKNKQHEFVFDIDDQLFELYEHSLVEKGRGKCVLVIEKSETMMTLKFDIDAEIELICDRSLDTFWHPVSLKEQLIIKFGEDDYALSEDVIVIRNDTASLDVSEYIYEYINLAVPMRKLHPRFENDEEDDESSEIFYTSGQGEVEEKTGTDPRWEALKKLKENK